MKQTAFLPLGPCACFLALALPLLSCRKSTSESTEKPDASVERTMRACPLTIIPGKSLGPLSLGQSTESLGATKLPVERVHSEDVTTFDQVGPLRVRACAGRIAEIWVDDMRIGPDCIEVGGKKIARKASPEEFAAFFKNCRTLEPRPNTKYLECEEGGVRIVTGLGAYMQVRVAAVGSEADDTCASALDDGGAVALDPDDLAVLLQRALDIDELAAYWHAERKGRTPLHVVKSAALTTTPPLTKFGSPVKWVEPAQAPKLEKSKVALFEFTRVDATARDVTLAFRFPVEGIVGTLRFKRGFAKHAGLWSLKERSIAER